MKPKHTILTKLAIASLVAIILAALAAGAAAASTVNATVAPPSSMSDVQARTHWSVERMQTAGTELVPTAPAPGANAAIAAKQGKPRVANPKARGVKKAKAARSSSAYSALHVYSQGWATWSSGYPKNVGRLYFDKPEGGSRCTATVVDTNLILTAAHCVWRQSGGETAYYRNFKFVPQQINTTEPHGSWVRGVPIVWRGWSTSGLYSKDYAFVKFPPSNGRNLADVVGASPFLANPPLREYYNLGYPASGHFAQWGGNYLWFCHSPYGGAYSDSGGFTIRMGCMGNGGVSGGPWYTNYAGSWKYIASVNSTCSHSTMHCNLSPGAYAEELRGPYFNNDTIELYKLARNIVAN